MMWPLTRKPWMSTTITVQLHQWSKWQVQEREKTNTETMLPPIVEGMQDLVVRTEIERYQQRECLRCGLTEEVGLIGSILWNVQPECVETSDDNSYVSRAQCDEYLKTRLKDAQMRCDGDHGMPVCVDPQCWQK